MQLGYEFLVFRFDSRLAQSIFILDSYIKNEITVNKCKLINVAYTRYIQLLFSTIIFKKNLKKDINLN